MIHWKFLLITLIFFGNSVPKTLLRYLLKPLFYFLEIFDSKQNEGALQYNNYNKIYNINIDLSSEI